MNCSKCGAELLEDAMFCSKCGSPVKQKLYCNKCGAELPEDAMFCHKCGTKVADANSTVSAQNSAETFHKKVGDIISFGTYKYVVWTSADDSQKKVAPITWRVLDITNEGNLFVVSEDVLDDKPFNPWDDNKRVNWADCSLRRWLNEEFLKEAFNDQEQSQIMTVNVKNKTENNDCEDTMDRIFLLSTEEVEKYFDSDNQNDKKGPSKDRICFRFHDAECVESYNKYHELHDTSSPSAWRLRTVYKEGGALCYPCCVDYDGSWKGRSNTYPDFFNTHDQHFGVRPAMIIKP